MIDLHLRHIVKVFSKRWLHRISILGAVMIFILFLIDPAGHEDRSRQLSEIAGNEITAVAEEGTLKIKMLEYIVEFLDK